MNRSTPGLPVHHQLPEFTQTQCPSSQWCHPAISSSVIPFSSYPQSLPASESFPMSQLFAWGGQSTGVSALASFLPKKPQGWSSEWTGWISLQSKGLSNRKALCGLATVVSLAPFEGCACKVPFCLRAFASTVHQDQKLLFPHLQANSQLFLKISDSLHHIYNLIQPSHSKFSETPSVLISSSLCFYLDF